jgi:uncharacterized protein YdeI (YjbR/CyaY-like superfamily)
VSQPPFQDSTAKEYGQQMKVGEIAAVQTRAEWRDWLQVNGLTIAEAWVLLYKKSSEKSGLSYDEAVEEALCFGWIDGFMRSYDSDRTVQRFTPRRPKSNWSESNRARVRKLAGAGLIQAPGIAAMPADLRAEVDNMRVIST